MSVFLLAVSLLAQTGCTHRQLRYDNVMQARTLTTIYEQQVLDNLAMFAQSPDSLPFFAVPGAGSASVTDTGSIAASPLNGPIRTIIGPLSLGRGNTQISNAKLLNHFMFMQPSNYGFFKHLQLCTFFASSGI